MLAENGFKRNVEQKEKVPRHSRLESDCLASNPVTDQLCLNCFICKMGQLIVIIHLIGLL